MCPRGSIEEWLDQEPLRRRVTQYVAAEAEDAYLVGGSIRDALLGRESYDLDLAVRGNAMSLARRVADRIRGAYVPLDGERDVARVVVRRRGVRQYLDFAGLRAGSIQADLWARDYTINAMAVSLDRPDELLDPTGGRDDLASGVLRVVRQDAFEEDPVRILRGVRLRGELGFALAGDTEALAREWSPALREVSAERIRDELVRMLNLGDAAESLTYAEALGVLGVVLPEIHGGGVSPNGAIRRVGRLEGLFNKWIGGEAPCARPGWREVERALGRYRGSLGQHWSEELSVGRTRWVCLKLGALLSWVPDAEVAARQSLRRLRFSAREMRFVCVTIRASERILAWVGERELAPLAVFRYYEAAGDAGVDGAIMSLVAGQAQLEGAEDASTRELRLSHVARLAEAWFDQRELLVDPPRLVTGRDVVDLFGLKPGPQVGRLLMCVREAQVQGAVSTRDEAIEYLRARLGPGASAS